MQRHYSDAELLEVLDGEGGRISRWRIQMHLFRCWECRGQKAELEEQAYRVAQAFRANRFPGPDRVALARERFERYVQTAAPAASPSEGFARGWRFALGGAALLVVAAGIAIAPRLVRPRVAAVADKERAAPAAGHAVTAAAQAMPVPAPEPVRIGADKPQAARVKTNRGRTEPAPPDLKLIEADVHYRLHRIGACAAEPVLIAARDRRTLSVTAIAPPDLRRREIEEALADLRRAGLVVFHVNGQTAEVPVEALGDASQTYTSTRLADSPLARSFASPEAFARGAAAAVKLAEAIYAEAWGLQRHSGIAKTDGSQNSPARWLAEAMEQDHSERIRTYLQRLRSELEPLGVAEPQECEAGPRRAALEAASEMAALIHRLFAPSTDKNLATAEIDADRLRHVIRALECAVRERSSPE